MEIVDVRDKDYVMINEKKVVRKEIFKKKKE